MDEQTAISAAATGGGGGLLWWLFRLYSDGKELRVQASKHREELTRHKEDVAAFKLHVSENYAQKIDLNRMESNIMYMLGQIQENQRDGFKELASKIDMKADK